MNAMLVVVLESMLLAGCVDATWSPGDAQQTSEMPTTGNDAQRDGFYDGGINDPDLTRRNLPLAE